MTNNIDRIVQALGGKQSDSGWSCHCPVKSHGQGNGDRNPSLSVSEKNGKVLVKCYAGCSQDAVLSELKNLGLRLSDNGSSDRQTQRREVARYRYTDGEGNPVFEVIRYEVEENGKRLKTYRTVPSGLPEEKRHLLYNLPKILDAREEQGIVFVVEGEKCADALNSRGFTATTNAHGSGKWTQQHAEQMAGLNEVISIPDHDDPGDKHSHTVVESLRHIARTVRRLDLPGLQQKQDIVDWFAAGNTTEDFVQLVAESSTNTSKTPIPSRIEFLKAQFVSGDDWLQQTPEALDPVIQNLFDRGDKALIVGAPSVRKSFFFLQMLLSISAGASFLKWAVPRPRKVAVIQFEVHQKHQHRRFLAMAGAMGLTELPNIKFLNARGLGITKGDLLPLLEGQGFDVVAVDPLYKLDGVAETDPEAMTELLRVFDDVTEKLNTALVYVHHDPKQGMERDLRDRGSGANQLMRDADSKIFITPHAEDEDRSVVVESLLRNYPPMSAFCAMFLHDCFIQHPSLEPEKKSRLHASLKKRAQMSRSKPLLPLVEQVKPWFNEGQVMSLAEFGEQCRSQFELSKHATAELKALCIDKLGLVKQKLSFTGGWLVGLPAAVENEMARQIVKNFN